MHRGYPYLLLSPLFWSVLLSFGLFGCITFSWTCITRCSSDSHDPFSGCAMSFVGVRVQLHLVTFTVAGASKRAPLVSVEDPVLSSWQAKFHNQCMLLAILRVSEADDMLLVVRLPRLDPTLHSTLLLGSAGSACHTRYPAPSTRKSENRMVLGRQHSTTSQAAETRQLSAILYAEL